MDRPIGSEGNGIEPSKDVLINPVTDPASNHMSDADGAEKWSTQAGYKGLVH